MTVRALNHHYDKSLPNTYIKRPQTSYGIKGHLYWVTLIVTFPLFQSLHAPSGRDPLSCLITLHPFVIDVSRGTTPPAAMTCGP